MNYEKRKYSVRSHHRFCYLGCYILLFWSICTNFNNTLHMLTSYNHFANTPKPYYNTR